MENKRNQTRGKAGGIALKLSSQNKVKQNKRTLEAVLKRFNEEKIPIIKTELAVITGLSIATLNRDPYKKMIDEYRNEEKALFSPKGKQEIAALIRENENLKDELKVMKEKYNRLKKEISYSRELFS